MFQPLDIFKTDSDGSVLWRGAVESLVAAKLRIQRLALSSPGEYLVIDQRTGERVRVVMGISTAATAAGALTTATA
jgi:hypothetical protein